MKKEVGRSVKRGGPLGKGGGGKKGKKGQKEGGDIKRTSSSLEKWKRMSTRSKRRSEETIKIRGVREEDPPKNHAPSSGRTMVGGSRGRSRAPTEGGEFFQFRG